MCVMSKKQLTDYWYNILYSHSRGSSLSLKLLLLLMCPLLLAHPFATWFKWLPSVLAPHIVSSSSGPKSGVAPATSTTDPGLKLVCVWSRCKRFSHRELSHGSEKTVCVSSLSLICEAQWWLLLGWLGCDMPLLWLWLEEHTVSWLLPWRPSTLSYDDIRESRGDKTPGTLGDTISGESWRAGNLKI